MRSSEINNRVFQFSRILFLILLTTISLLLFVNGRSGFALLLIFTSLSTLLIFAAFFTHHYLPEVPHDTLMKLLGKTITQRFSSHQSMIHILNGKINGDLILPKTRRSNIILHIDQNSAVIALDQKTGDKLMLTGIHNLPSTASLQAVLPTSLQRVVFGPESADSLSKARSSESLADFHVRINAAKKAATIAADGIVVYPKFECFYRIDIDHPNEGIVALIKRIVEKDKFPAPATQTDSLQKFIFVLILNQWEKVCSGKTSGQLLNEVPFKLFVDGFAKYGLSGLVFVSEIFLEN